MNAQQKTAAADKQQRPSRPAIPAEIARAVLFEAGHRCSVCGAECPLERAHIVPWREAKEHTADNLICLCANCHSRADAERWDFKALRQYKRRPWVLRHRESREHDPFPIARVSIRLTIDMDIDDLSEKTQRLLRYAVASFLELSPEEIKIKKVEKGSVKLTLEIPRSSMSRVSSASTQGALAKFLLPLDVTKVEMVNMRLEELRLLLIWREVLGIESIGLTDNFFDHCGDPSLRIKLHSRLQQEFGIPVDLAQLPTIEAQARFIKHSRAIAERASQGAGRVAKRGKQRA